MYTVFTVESNVPCDPSLSAICTPIPAGKNLRNIFHHCPVSKGDECHYYYRAFPTEEAARLALLLIPPTFASLRIVRTSTYDLPFWVCLEHAERRKKT